MGDYIKKKRLESDISVEQAAKQIGINKATLRAWEHHYNQPNVSQVPRVIAFLGYVPELFKAASIGEKIRMIRTMLGLTQRQLAQIFDTSSWTVGQWERNKIKPPEDIIEKIKKEIEQQKSKKGPGLDPTYSC